MAIIVQHKEIQNNYVLIGTRLEIYKSYRPRLFLPDFCLIENQENFRLVAVADRNGEIK
jgi:hypothetical protein